MIVANLNTIIHGRMPSPVSRFVQPHNLQVIVGGLCLLRVQLQCTCQKWRGRNLAGGSPDLKDRYGWGQTIKIRHWPLLSNENGGLM